MAQRAGAIVGRKHNLRNSTALFKAMLTLSSGIPNIGRIAAKSRAYSREVKFVQLGEAARVLFGGFN